MSLDVPIYRCERTFKFDVYRKPTNVLSYFHFYSSHHIKTKKAVLSSMFLRALRICSSGYNNGEIATNNTLQLISNTSRISLIVPWLEQ